MNKCRVDTWFYFKSRPSENSQTLFSVRTTVIESYENVHPAQFAWTYSCH